MSAFFVSDVELDSMLTSVCFSTFRAEQERRRRDKNKTEKILFLFGLHSKNQAKKPTSPPLANLGKCTFFIILKVHLKVLKPKLNLYKKEQKYTQRQSVYPPPN
jgi:hypothetical protein